MPRQVRRGGWRRSRCLTIAGSTWRSRDGGRSRETRRSRTTQSLFRQPITTLDDDLGARAARRGAGRADRRVRAVATRTTTRSCDAGGPRFGPPMLAPPSVRDGYGFEQHVRTMWERRGGEVPEAWYRLAVFYFSNVSELRGPGDPVWAPRGSEELDYELEVAALDRYAGPRPAPRSAPRRRSAATRSSTTGRHATSSATRRRSGSGRRRARTSRARSGRGW